MAVGPIAKAPWAGFDFVGVSPSQSSRMPPRRCPSAWSRLRQRDSLPVTALATRHDRKAAVPQWSAATLVGGMAGLTAAAMASMAKPLSRKAVPSDEKSRALGAALISAATWAPTGLKSEATTAYKLVSNAANEGLLEFAGSGDFGAVGQKALKQRKEFIALVVNEIESGRADLDLVAEHLVDAALARAARCVEGHGSGVYKELWVLDENRASVGTVRGSPRQTFESSWRQNMEDMDEEADILVDEQRQGTEEKLRPLFAQVRTNVLAHPSALALLDVFEVYRRRGDGSQASLTQKEKLSIEAFLHEVERTPVMRRCKAEARSLLGETWSDEEWHTRLERMWFEPPYSGRKSGFEHIFVGEASTDSHGRDVVGGLHNWFKFYLEEQRGTARYLGYRYPGRAVEKEAAANPQFVSGRFTWDNEGRHLVKDVGGFFVGVSIEWQMAVATTAFFETSSPETALARRWTRDIKCRDLCYVRTVRFGTNIYRFTICRCDDGHLTTFFATQLGVWDTRARLELDESLTTRELEEKLPGLLVLHGFADDPELLAVASRVGAAGAFTLREALKHLKTELNYDFVDSSSDPATKDLMEEVEFHQVVAKLVEAYDTGRLSSSGFEELLDTCKESLGLKGRKLFRPVRLALTGKTQGHDLKELLSLLELLDAGAPWSKQLAPLKVRMDTLRAWLEVNEPAREVTFAS
mmetsp:Transcript_25895/g.59785  ORF Transcript_25895/g.59785 Transcript_25895/m.59785 type:complete len:696 (+) Transcript_25895:37-2124(+)